MISSQIGDLVNEQLYVQSMIDNGRSHSLNHREMWNVCCDYVDKVLTAMFQHYSNGVPTLSSCKVQMIVRYPTKNEILSGSRGPTYIWKLRGPRETLGGDHRKIIDITNEGYYLSARPDPAFCYWLLENKLVEKLVEIS
jgi:hypothetical protein